MTETYPPEVNGVAQTMAHLMAGLRLQGYSVSLVRPRQRQLRRLRSSLSARRHVGSESAVARLSRIAHRRARQTPRCGVAGPSAAPMSSMSRPRVRWAGRRLAQRASSGIPVFSGFHTNFDAYSKHYHAGWLRFLIWRYLSAFHNRTAGTLVPCAELRGRLQAMGLRNVSVLGRGVDG